MCAEEFYSHLFDSELNERTRFQIWLSLFQLNCEISERLKNFLHICTKYYNAFYVYAFRTSRSPNVFLYIEIMIFLYVFQSPHLFIHSLP